MAGSVINVGVANHRFPDENIHPDQKGYLWCMEWAKAAWHEQSGLQNGQFYFYRDWFSLIESYAAGNQSVDKYKANLEIGDEANESWVNVDWTPLKVYAKIRRMAIARTSKTDYNIVATPIDPLAISAADKEFAELKAKLKIKEEMNIQAPGTRLNEMVAPSAGDPLDTEELQVIQKFTPRMQMAREAEQLVDVILNHNKFDETRRQGKENTFDFGVSVYKDWVSSNGTVKARLCKPKDMIVSRCRYKDFHDVRYCGEIREMLLSDLADEAQGQFSMDDYRDIANAVAGHYDNPRSAHANLKTMRDFNMYRIRVLDLEWFSLDHLDYQVTRNNYGNTMVSRAKPGDKGSDKTRVLNKKVKMVYKMPWIIGTDYGYNWGKATNIKRERNRLTDASLSYHIYTPEKDEGLVTSTGDQLIPMIDQLHVLWYKYQMLVSQLKSDGIAIEMGAIEDIPLGQGGKNLKPLNVLDLYNQKAMLIYRRVNSAGDYSNALPITELKTGNGDKIITVWNQMLQVVEMMKWQVGLNDFTDSVSPDPRALKSVVAAAEDSSNNALYYINRSDMVQMKSLCNGLFMRGQIVIRKGGKINGYTNALGDGTTMFFRSNKRLSLYQFGIDLELAPTHQEKMELISYANQFLGSGLVDMTDIIMIRNCRNLKMAEALLSVRIDRRKKEKQAEQERSIMLNGQANAESGKQVEQARQNTEAMAHGHKMQQIDLEKGWEYKIKELEMSMRAKEEELKATEKLIRAGVTQESKEEIARMKQAESRPAASEEQKDQ